jgi:hypothetical protein
MSFGQNKFPKRLSFFRSVKITLRFLGAGGTAEWLEEGEYAAMQHPKSPRNMHFVMFDAFHFDVHDKATENSLFYPARRKTEFICNSLVPPAIFQREGDRLNDG